MSHKKIEIPTANRSSSANLTGYMSQLMRNHLLPNPWNHHNNCVTTPSEKLWFREKRKCLFWVAINAGILGGRWRQSLCGTLRGGRLPLTSACFYGINKCKRTEERTNTRETVGRSNSTLKPTGSHNQEGAPERFSSPWLMSKEEVFFSQRVTSLIPLPG